MTEEHDPGRINVHQIGSRGANASWFPRLRAFRDECVFHQYDADGGCVDQVERILTASGFHHTNHTRLLGREEGEGWININYDPFTSSVHPLNPRMANCHIHHALQGDYILGQTFETVERRAVPATTIDHLAARGVPFDILELDTQGSEIDILEGGRKTISDSVIAIFTEVSMDEAYLGQCLFDDVLRFCRGHGFRFISFHEHNPTSWYRAPVGWRGEGLCMFADALFLKAPDRIRAEHRDPFASLMKLAFASLISGRFDDTLECLEMASDLPRPPGGKWRHIDIPLKLHELLRRETQLEGVMYRDVWSLEESMDRFHPDRSSTAIWDRDTMAIRRRYFSRVAPGAFRENIRKLISPRLNTVEIYLADNDLALTAGRLRDNRIAQAMELLNLLGFTRRLGGVVVIDDPAIDAFVEGRDYRPPA